jgi:hypothetical protein
MLRSALNSLILTKRRRAAYVLCQLLIQTPCSSATLSATFAYASLGHTRLPEDRSIAYADFTGANWWASRLHGDVNGAAVEYVFNENKISEWFRIDCPHAETGTSISEDQTTVEDQHLSISLCAQSHFGFQEEFERKFPRSNNEPRYKNRQTALNRLLTPPRKWFWESNDNK